MQLRIMAGLAASFAIIAGPAMAEPEQLSIRNVDVRTINCLFSTSCALLNMEDLFADIPVPAIQHKAILMSRTFAGGPGSPAQGKTAYQYRIDLLNAIPVGDSACVLNLTVDFGEVTKLRYGVVPGDVYQITKDAPENQIHLLSAEQDGDLITFTFERPICAGAGNDGDTTVFFGLASIHLPRPAEAKVDAAGADDLKVKARMPLRRRP
jgi:hypothetical protein